MDRADELPGEAQDGSVPEPPPTPAPAPSPPAQRAFWREGIEAAVMAITMALFLKYFVIEAYKIPTGSMQPTLIGDESADINDRILVDKLSYVFRAPERWEVAVFRYPLDRSKSFVKRIAGVGPEELRIRDGDVWNRPPGGTWSVARRPRAVMETHWKRLDVRAPEHSHWIADSLPRDSHWTTEGRDVLARGPGTATFRGGHESIVDEYMDGYPEELVPWLPPYHRESGQNPVGDLRLSGTVRALGGTKRVTFVLREGDRRYRFALPGPAAPADAGASIEAGRGRSASGAFRLPAGERLAFAVENLDDRLALELEGHELLALEIEPAANQFSSVTLQVEGEGADLEDLMVFRDIYYTSDEPGSIEIPAGSYFMLGDNTQDSSDSREWTFAVWELQGEPEGSGTSGTSTRVRGNWRERENPRTVGIGSEDGPWTLVVDEWGEKHWFRRGEARREAPERAPFVPRDLVQGRALAVFWPQDPGRAIWRLGWIH